MAAAARRTAGRPARRPLLRCELKLGWVTDIHLNFLTRPQVEAWCQRELVPAGFDALVVSGDIAEADDVVDWLELLAAQLERPIHFVLGNHDYYGGRIAAVRERVRACTQRVPGLTWLGDADVVPLTARTGLIGCDGWGDARHGDHASSPIALNDFRQIEDLRGLDKPALGDALRALGDLEANQLRRALPLALDRFEHVLCVTHVPPFREACQYEGEVADDDWAPYFTCQAVGDALQEALDARPERTLTVLCGHTHTACEVTLRPNLTVRCGGAEYGHPALQPLLELA